MDTTACTTVAQLTVGDQVKVTVGSTNTARISEEFRHFSAAMLHPT